MYILGINYSHDESVALIRDGKVCVAIAEERLNRIKHSTGILLSTNQNIRPKVLPWQSIAYCLQTEKIGLEDLDLVMIDHAVNPVDLEYFRRQIPIKDPHKIQSIPHPSHHLAHAYSTYFCSPFEESAILIMDNIGSYLSLYEKESESTFYAKGLEIFLLHRYTATRDLEENAESPANLYRLITLLLGFTNHELNFGQTGKLLGQYDDAGKTMGLAPYGNFRKDWESWVQEDDKGNPIYIPLLSWLKRKGFLKLRKFSTGNKKTDLTFLALATRENHKTLTQLQKDLAYKAQDEIEKSILILTRHLHQELEIQNLCLAGGVALNSVANKKILDQGLFKKIFVQPAATDDGNAIGTAMYGYINILKGKRRSFCFTPFLGKDYSDQEIEKALKKFSLHQATKYEDKEAMLDFISKQISNGKVIGWFQGKSEFGPRALGNRSILADPRKNWMRDYLNFEVKGREWFRPFAPAVLSEHTKDYFDFDGESPFMLMVAPVKKDKIKKIPAITHIDGTARLQTVEKINNPLFHDLISNFYKLTGTPLVLNTSFNIKGFPIVETPADGIWSFLNSPIDYLVIGSYVIGRDLYANNDLLCYYPLRIVKIEKDNSRKPKSYIHPHPGLKLFSLTSLERRILEACNGKKSIKEILNLELVGKRKQVLNLFRTFIRNQWIFIFASHLEIIKGGKT